jgi:hypothetical protein
VVPSDECTNGLISYQRRPLEMQDDSDFDTENRKHKATERYSVAGGGRTSRNSLLMSANGPVLRGSNAGTCASLGGQTISTGQKSATALAKIERPGRHTNANGESTIVPKPRVTPSKKATVFLSQSSTISMKPKLVFAPFAAKTKGRHWPSTTATRRRRSVGCSAIPVIEDSGFFEMTRNYWRGRSLTSEQRKGGLNVA